MRKFLCILLSSICCIFLVACGSNEDYTGEAKTPSGSSIMKGKDYKSVIDEFEDEGFTNIKLEKIEDLITGWLTKEGEVEEVSVGGDLEYSPEEWVQADTEVIIKYHAFPEKRDEETEQSSEENTNPEDAKEDNNKNGGEKDLEDEILTIDNCEELASMLSNKAEIDESYSTFASKYAGRIIEFDGRIDYVVNNASYKTRYDILVTAGDYDPNHQIGPAFKFENVNANDLGLDALYLEDKIQVGKNVRIVAEVGKFDSNSGLFFLKPVSVIER